MGTAFSPDSAAKDANAENANAFNFWRTIVLQIFSETKASKIAIPITKAVPMVKITNAVKRFPGLGRKEMLVALDHVTIEIPRGEFVALIGSNGAGKSTLLSIVMGTTLLDEGSFHVAGEDMTNRPSCERASKVALVRQNPEHNVLATLSIEENFALAMMGRAGRFPLKRYKRETVRHAAHEALSRFGMGLESRMAEAAGTLSGGQRQAVAMAMAAVRQPQVLLLDEHTSALDPKRARILREVTEQVVRESGMTTMMVTHDMGHALAETDRVLMMHRGRVVMNLSGAEKNALTVPELATRFEHLVGEALSDRTILANAG